MKKLIILIFVLSFFVHAEAFVKKPFYIGESKCFEGLINDQNGNSMVPNAGDVVTMTLKRTPTSTPDLLVLTGVYVADNDDYNYTFSVDSDETEDLAAGNAYWYLELTNTANKIHIVIAVTKTVIKR